jgi:hypothetical protein
MADTRPPFDSAVVDLTLVECLEGWKLWEGVWRRWDGVNVVVGVGLLQPQTANGSESVLTASLAATQLTLPTSIQLPAQLRGRASIASPGPLLGANTPIHQQKTGGVVLSSSEAR